MKKLLTSIIAATFFITGTAFILNPTPVMAGECTVRDTVNWHATITSAVFLRSDCPTGDIIGTVPAGEEIQILEVDRFSEFYLVKTSVGTGFLYSSFLKDITQSPLPGTESSTAEDEPTYPNSIFIDLNPNHKYYDEIADLKEKGIIGGNPEGEINADDPVNRAELAKILVEATTDDSLIEDAVLDEGVYFDVQLGAWYTPYLQIAREKGIMSGDWTGKNITTVRPGDNANGAEVAKMISEAFTLDIIVSDSETAWYAPYMNILEEMDVLPYSSPSHIVTRGEMMYMVSGVLGD